MFATMAEVYKEARHEAGEWVDGWVGEWTRHLRVAGGRLHRRKRLSNPVEQHRFGVNFWHFFTIFR